jgi:hypothetical protein
MKQIIIILICLAFFCSCSKNKRQLFSEKDTAISFYDNNDINGIVNVNFLFYPETQKEVTIKIPLRISGIPQNHDRYYSVSIVKEGENKTTAQENTHYEKLKEKYLFRKGLYQDTLCIIIKKDKSLKDKIYKLTLKLKETKDFKLGPNEKEEDGFYQLQMVITMNANLDIPPKFWKKEAYDYDDYDYGRLSKRAVGPYHPKKCQKFIEIAGIKNENWKANTEMDMILYIKETKKWFRENVRTDKNGNRLWFENK